MYYYNTNNTIKPVTSKITVPADAASVVTLVSLKNHLGLYDDTSEDTYLASVLLAATDFVSNYTGYDIEETQRSDLFLTFHQSMTLVARELKSGSAVTISYYNTAGVLTVVDPSTYIVDTTSDPVKVKLKADQQYPSDISAEFSNPIVIGYTSLLNEENTQAVIKHAILMICSELYQNRDDSTNQPVNKLPLSAERLLSAYRRVQV